MLKVTPHQLSEYLNNHEKINFFQYINYLRVNDAKKMLKAKEKSIIEVCYEVGYNTPATFFKAFKADTGMTPKERQKTP